MKQLSNFPSTYLITPEPCLGEPLDNFIADLERSLLAGIRLVQLRAKSVTEPQYVWLAEQALECCRRHSARLLLSAPLNVALTVEADGVHLTSTRLMSCNSRPMPPEFLLSVACHDARQIRHAEQIGADLITLSPVLPTKTHTSAEPLGWARFRELVSLTSIPVYALGGMSAQTLPAS
ncbi:thiamine phosphate synthase, partial [Pandoraea sp. NPDC087047]|uniref:thiamine phosphate synthase n=1 Tax=Pandoraea sp. NPDC087047 TaxID=3364390 RepID=UPI00381608F2